MELQCLLRALGPGLGPNGRDESVAFPLGSRESRRHLEVPGRVLLYPAHRDIPPCTSTSPSPLLIHTHAHMHIPHTHTLLTVSSSSLNQTQVVKNRLCSKGVTHKYL